MTELGRLFEEELRALARIEKALKAQEDYLKQQVEAIQAKVEDELQSLREQLDRIAELRQAQRDKLMASVHAYLNQATDAKQEKAMRQNLHHLISVRNKTVFDYDAEAAREIVIKNKDWRFINKPTLSKSKLQAAIKRHEVDWLDYKVSTERSVSIGKLGELLIIMENEEDNSA